MVHVHHRLQSARDEVAGVVEVVGDGGWHRFENFEQLRALLTEGRSGAPDMREPRNTGAPRRRRRP